MKKVLSLALCLLVVVTAFPTTVLSVSAETSATVTFHSNNITASEDIFKIVSADNAANIFYDIPDTDSRYLFKGWYYDKFSDKRPVDFENDVFDENTDVYARYIEIDLTPQDSGDSDSTELHARSDFELAGVQLKSDGSGGLRFVGSLSNSLLEKIDALSDKTIEGSKKLEYGFLMTKEKNIENWLSFAAGHVDPAAYKLSYNGSNVNGVDTTKHNENYQGFVMNVDCTAGDYSGDYITDYKSFDGYRLYTAAVNYSSENAESQKGVNIAARAYLRYYDSNGRLRTFFNDYGGTNTYGGCSASYNSVSAAPQSEQWAYYSDLIQAVKDLNSLTTDNADSDAYQALCALRIEGETAHLKLLSNADIGNTGFPFKSDCEFDLGGNTITSGSGIMQFNKNARIFNGSFNIGSTAPVAFATYGDETELINLDFKADSVEADAFYGAAYCGGKKATVNFCTFDLNCANSSGRVTVINSQSAIEELSVKNSKIKVSGTAGIIYGIYSHSTEGAAKGKHIYENCEFDFDLENLAQYAYALRERYTPEFELLDCDFDIVTENSGNNDVFAVLAADITSSNLSGDKIKIRTSDNNSYKLYGVYKSNGEMRISDVDISVPLTNEDKNVGVYSCGTGTTTITEDDGSVKIHGGHSAIHNYDTSKFIIYGGTYSSPTHGGVYFCADADVYGGYFYNSMYVGDETDDLLIYKNPAATGAFYASRMAVVNIDNARIAGGINALRLQKQSDGENNPIVTVRNTYIESDNFAIGIAAGVVYLENGTVTKPAVSGDGTTIIDHRGTGE